MIFKLKESEEQLAVIINKVISLKYLGEKEFSIKNKMNQPLTNFENLEEKFSKAVLSAKYEELVNLVKRNNQIYLIANGGLHYVASHMATDMSRLIKDKYCYSFDSFGFGWVIGFEQKLNFHISSLQIDEKRAEKSHFELKRKSAIKALKLDFQKNQSAFQKAKDAVKSLKKGFKAARNLFRISSDGFDLGTNDAEDLLSAYGSYVEAKAAYLRAVFLRNQYWLRMAEHLTLKGN